MYDTIIVGSGPAGVTAALYIARAGFKSAILHKDYGVLATAESIDNYYGHVSISGIELAEIGLKQVKELNVDIINAEAVGLSVDGTGNMVVETTDDTYTARTSILATGATRTTAKIPGIKELEGYGVSYCAVCDGFFHRGRDIAVLGSSSYALHEVEALLDIAGSVTLLTNGNEITANFPSAVNICTKKIASVNATKGMVGDILKSVQFEDETELEISGLFVALGIAGGTELARKVGAEVEGTSVLVNGLMQTSVPKLWAAGDCTPGMKQIAKAVYQGAEAGIDIVRHLRK